MIDLLIVDVQGHEVEVLGSADFIRKRPRFVNVEVESNDGTGIHAALISKGYKLLLPGHDRVYVDEKFYVVDDLGLHLRHTHHGDE